MIYKKGDKVRILGADEWNIVAKKYIGWSAIIDVVNNEGKVCRVKVCKENNRYWSIQNNSEIELWLQSGQQLEFSFMEE